jgi:hypothetical protein
VRVRKIGTVKRRRRPAADAEAQRRTAETRSRRVAGDGEEATHGRRTMAARLLRVEDKRNTANHYDRWDLRVIEASD